MYILTTYPHKMLGEVPRNVQDCMRGIFRWDVTFECFPPMWSHVNENEKKSYSKYVPQKCPCFEPYYSQFAHAKSQFYFHNAYNMYKIYPLRSGNNVSWQ